VTPSILEDLREPINILLCGATKPTVPEPNQRDDHLLHFFLLLIGLNEGFASMA
jgi:hypothetical protein